MIFVLGNSSGGGGGPTSADAILTVTAPAGATVTATKGSTTLTPTLWTAAADATQECALFVISAAQFDSSTPWTVTATRGTATSSGTVTIDSNAQYSLNLAKRFFIRNGAIVDADFSIIGNLTTAEESGALVMTTASNNSGAMRSASIDLSGFSQLVLELTGENKSWKGTGVPAIGIGDNVSMSGASVIGFYAQTYLNSATGSINTQRYILDLSTITGSYQVACTVGGSSSLSGRVGYLRVVNFYLA